MVSWPVPENIEITVTLFRDNRQAAFEDKEWTFVIEDVSEKYGGHIITFISTSKTHVHFIFDKILNFCEIL